MNGRFRLNLTASLIIAGLALPLSGEAQTGQTGSDTQPAAGVSAAPAGGVSQPGNRTLGANVPSLGSTSAANDAGRPTISGSFLENTSARSTSGRSSVGGIGGGTAIGSPSGLTLNPSPGGSVNSRTSTAPLNRRTSRADDGVAP
jgi:hypothetical protein